MAIWHNVLICFQQLSAHHMKSSLGKTLIVTTGGLLLGMVGYSISTMLVRGDFEKEMSMGFRALAAFVVGVFLAIIQCWDWIESTVVEKPRRVQIPSVIDIHGEAIKGLVAADTSKEAKNILIRSKKIRVEEPDFLNMGERFRWLVDNDSE